MHKQRMLCSSIVIISMFFGNILNSSGVDAEFQPNWTYTVKEDVPPRDPDNDCKKENDWSVAPHNSRVYLKSSETLCIYYGKNYAISHYEREYYYIGIPWVTQVERGFAVSLNDNIAIKRLIPVPDLPAINNMFDMINRNGFDNKLLYYGEFAGVNSRRIYMYDNFPASLTYDPITNVYNVDTTQQKQLQLDNGQSISSRGRASVSNDGRWMVILASTGLVRYDTMTEKFNNLLEISKIPLSQYPQSTVRSAISTDGNEIILSGRVMPFYILRMNDYCQSEFQSDTFKNCPVIDMTDYIQKNIQASSNGIYDIDNISFEKNSSSFVINDHSKWYKFTAFNATPDHRQYLALGDSFASGEGDMALYGAHYLNGTNVYGNYPSGIPREMCHISDRSYPFLLAKQFNYALNETMQSIACSGAVVGDMFSNNFRDNYSDISYLGQTTQNYTSENSSIPRLKGLLNAEQLKLAAINSFLPGRVQQIELIKKSKPDVITLSIGGNDVGFGEVMTECAANFRVLNVGGKCKYVTRAGMEQAANLIDTKYDDLLNLYKAIKQVSPDTKLFIIGYPQFFNVSSPCQDMMKMYSLEERQVISAFIDYVNATIRTAANNAGATFIDISPALSGKEMCGKSTGMTGIDDLMIQKIYTETMRGKDAYEEFSRNHPILSKLPAGSLSFMELYKANRIMEGISEFAYSPSTAILGAAQQLSHPNEIGHQAIAESIHKGFGADDLFGETCSSTIICPNGNQIAKPLAATYLDGLEGYRAKKALNGDSFISIGTYINNDEAKIEWNVLRTGDRYAIRFSKGQLDSIDIKNVKIGVLHSDPVKLGEFIETKDSYELEGVIPANIPVGLHTLVIEGTDIRGEPVELLKSIMVEGPRGDIDGDGIINAKDGCAFGDSVSNCGFNLYTIESKDYNFLNRFQSSSKKVSTLASDTGENKSILSDDTLLNSANTTEPLISNNLRAENSLHNDSVYANQSKVIWTAIAALLVIVASGIFLVSNKK